MNLDQLALQCYEECGDYHLGSVSQFNHKKFAELIVRECLKCGDKLAKCYIENHPEYEQAWLLASNSDYSKQIELTFGVK